jgi:hypothetical protein
MTARTVWAITSGSYSDYRVLALFATKAAAEAQMRRPSPPGSWTEPDDLAAFLLYEADDEPRQVTTYERQIEIWDDGTTSNPRESVRTEWEFDTMHGRPSKRPQVRFVRAPVHKGKGGRLEVRGSDKSAVDKAYSDQIVQRVAKPA